MKLLFLLVEKPTDFLAGAGSGSGLGLAGAGLALAGALDSDNPNFSFAFLLASLACARNFSPTLASLSCITFAFLNSSCSFSYAFLAYKFILVLK